MNSSSLMLARSYIEARGYEFDASQPHTQGERHISLDPRVHGEKYVLLGKNAAGERVVIKIGLNSDARAEIRHERKCRDVLSEMRFAYRTFFSPSEIDYIEHDAFTFLINEYVDQPVRFLDRALREQFMIATRGLEAQESAHAVAYSHLRQVKKYYEMRDASKYSEQASRYAVEILKAVAVDPQILNAACTYIRENESHIDQYARFLTHWDFVPHNMRITENAIYLLDHSSLVFGNKYESWARFINFMALYHPALADALISYVRLNRPLEMVSLRAMRMFRLLELIWCYALTLEKVSGAEKKLNEARVEFWTALLSAVIDDQPIDPEKVMLYRETRDSLRSNDEKARQKILH